jgi:hypothetical protein
MADDPFPREQDPGATEEHRVKAESARKVRSVPPCRILRDETPTVDTTLGVHVADLPTMELRTGDRVNLTVHWRDADRWEGSDFLVFIE